MFNVSKCPKCNGMAFKLEAVEPAGSRVKMNFVQCSSCHAPVGVVDFFDSGSLLKAQEAVLKNQSLQIDDISSRVQHVERLVAQIANLLNQRR